MAYILKAPIPKGRSLSFPSCKVMYGGRDIAPGDEIFLFDSETHDDAGLVARGRVTAVAHLPPPDKARFTPRVSIAVARTGLAKTPLGRAELRPHRGGEGPAAEIDFKFYRQATDKIGGISDACAAWLRRRFF